MAREEQVVQWARRSFQTGKSKPLEFRLQQLKRLQSFIQGRHKDIKGALQKDLGKVGNSFITHTLLFCSLDYAYC